MLDAIDEELEQVASSVRTPSLTVTTVAELGTPAATIARAARERNAVAIVMTTSGRGGVARAFLGSVATGLLHHAPAPLLLAGPAATHAGTGAQRASRTEPAVSGR
jgi:nucleotide-binding universal stress UspA family protein